MLTNVKVTCKRALCLCEHPEWTLQQEMKIARYRNFLVHGSIEYKNRFFAEQVNVGIKRYDMERADTEMFKAVWYGPKSSLGYDNKVILYAHGQSSFFCVGLLCLLTSKDLILAPLPLLAIFSKQKVESM